MTKNWLFVVVILLYNHAYTNGEFIDVIRNIGTYFGYSKPAKEPFNNKVLDHSVPYEVAVPDEKFISEAAKITGVALPELDSCQHRVVLRLQTSCEKMNDEQLAKMAVMLLNCQSAVEGRTIYPCTETMSIKDCTSSMDADTWNSYHLMSNRARAVCYSVRQVQFRGLTELTINRLMDAARHQLFTLDKLSKDQENLHTVAQQSLSSISKGQDLMLQQQEDLQKAQLHGQLVFEDNIRRLTDEKRLILETHNQLTQMTRSVQNKLEQTALQIKRHATQDHNNHQKLLDDLVAIQNKMEMIFQQIEDSSNLLLKQSEAAHRQYQATLAQLAEVNSTVYSLVTMVGGTRKVLEERLAWLNAALGGTDLAIERLYTVMWHTAFIFVAMISCAFLNAPTITRFIVVALPAMNLIMALQQSSYALNPIEFCITVTAVIAAQVMVFSAIILWQHHIPQKALLSVKQKLTPIKNRISANWTPNSSSSEDTNHESVKNIYSCNSSHLRGLDESLETDTFDFSFRSPAVKNGSSLLRSRSRTPSIIDGFLKGACGAKTRMGTSCKLSAMPGKDFCYRHQRGDSVICG